MDVENFGIWAFLEKLITHRMNQVGFAQTDPAIDKQRVVKLTRHGRHMHSSSACHSVGSTFDQAVECQSCIEPIARPGGCVLFNPNKCFGKRLHLMCITNSLSPDLLIFGSDR